MPGIAVMSTPDLELERSIDYLRKEWGRKEGRKEGNQEGRLEGETETDTDGRGIKVEKGHCTAAASAAARNEIHHVNLVFLRRSVDRSLRFRHANLFLSQRSTR